MPPMDHPPPLWTGRNTCPNGAHLCVCACLWVAWQKTNHFSANLAQRENRLRSWLLCLSPNRLRRDKRLPLKAAEWAPLLSSPGRLLALPWLLGLTKRSSPDATRVPPPPRLGSPKRPPQRASAPIKPTGCAKRAPRASFLASSVATQLVLSGAKLRPSTGCHGAPKRTSAECLLSWLVLGWRQSRAGALPLPLISTRRSSLAARLPACSSPRAPITISLLAPLPLAAVWPRARLFGAQARPSSSQARALSLAERQPAAEAAEAACQRGQKPN